MIVVEWIETSKADLDFGTKRRRTFEYDQARDVVLDKTDGVETMEINIDDLSKRDIAELQTHEARKLVDFAKKKRGVK